jgi:hypothetical protein
VVPSDYLEVVATRKYTTMISDLLRAGKISSSWNWNNVPLPEPHIVGILSSAVLHLARPWRLPGSKRLYSGAGWALVGAGVAISASAVRAASDVNLERPSTLICSGPTLSAATRCMSVGPCSMLEVRLSHETHGWSHYFQWWRGSSTETFFERSTRWREYSGKSTSGIGIRFVDIFSG